MLETIDSSIFDHTIKTGPYALMSYREKFGLFHDGIVGPDQCVLWSGTFCPNGYGRFVVLKQEMLAHRVSYLLYKGSLQGTDVLRHTCDNKKCINPHHLLPGSQQDNMDDMVMKGRSNPAKGESSGMSKLSNEDVISIFEDQKQGVSAKYTAARLGVRQNHIYRIRNGKRWNHIEEIKV